MIDLGRVHEINTNDVTVRVGLARLREDAGDISELASSIKSKGQIHPILLTDRNELIAGGRRLLACAELNIPVKAIYRSEVSDVELRELELEENLQRKDLTWHEKNAMIAEITRLKQSIHGVGGTGRDAGWSKQDTADMMNVSRGAISQAISLAQAVEAFPELKGAETESDARKMMRQMEEAAILTVLRQRKNEFVPTGAKIADECYIIKDAIQGLRDLPSESFDFADVDTPYGVDFNQVKGTTQAQSGYIEWKPEKYLENIAVIIPEVFRVLKPNAWMMFWPGMQYLTEVISAIKAAGFKMDPMPNLWDCGDTGLTLEPNYYLGRSYDMFLVCRKGSAIIARPGRSNIFRYARVKDKQHMAEKPFELMVDIVNTYCLPGVRGIVPFMGSGNTVRALIKLGGSGMGFDMNEDSKLKFTLKVEEDCK